MAILFDASTDVILRTANIPVMNGGPYTVGFWFYLVTAPTGGDPYQSLFCINSSSDYDQVGLQLSGANTRLYVAVDNGSYFETLGSTNISTNTWYYVELVRSSTTSLIAYLNGVSEATQTNAASTQTSNRMDFGVHPQFSSDDFKGRIAAIKIWDGALSAEERANERWTYQPARYSNLNLWSPCFAGSGERTRDYSGNGRDWTAGGTLTDADGPPLRWGFSPPSGYYIPAAGGGGHTVAVDQVTETDTVQAVARLKTKQAGQITETDTAQTITRVKVKAAGQVAETDAAQAMTGLKAKLLGQVTEGDLAQAVTWAPKTRLVGQISETDLAQAVARVKAKALAQATETDTAQAIAWAPKIRQILQVAEADIAQALTRLKTQAVALVAESDLAQAVARLKAKLLGQVAESDLAQTVSTSSNQVVDVGQVTETETAQAITGHKTRALGQATHTEVAQAITARKTLAVALMTETDTAQGVTRVKLSALAQVAEADTAQALARIKIKVLAQVTETDMAAELVSVGPVVVASNFGQITYGVYKAVRKKR